MALLPLVVGVMLLTSIVGCEHKQLNQSNNIHYVQIQETVQPAVLYAQIGDEIRWQNLSDKVVHMRFLGSPNWEMVTCESGFRWMGLRQDSATIKPKEYVSLCFSKPNTIQFNVWMDWENSQGNISPTWTVHVEKEFRHTEPSGKPVKTPLLTPLNPTRSP
jgi:plastocyanin